MERKLRYSWIIPERLAVGERPPSFFYLHSLGFTAALSLQEEHEVGPGDSPPEGFDLRRVPVPDGIWGGVPTIEQIRQAAEAIDELLGLDRKTYVFCYAGIGRSPLVCMAYLAVSESLCLADAYRKVLEAHLPAEPTAAQLLALRSFLAARGAGPFPSRGSPRGIGDVS